MYKIYRIKLKRYSLNYHPFTYYILCRYNIVMDGFYMIPSHIIETQLSTVGYNIYEKFASRVIECIYESSDPQEAVDYLEQLRVLESV